MQEDDVTSTFKGKTESLNQPLYPKLCLNEEQWRHKIFRNVSTCSSIMEYFMLHEFRSKNELF